MPFSRSPQRLLLVRGAEAKAPGWCLQQRVWATSRIPPLTQLGLRRPRAGFWGVPAPGAGPGCGCARLHWHGSAAAPGGPVLAAVVRGAAALPIPALPDGAGRTTFAEELGRKINERSAVKTDSGGASAILK